MEYPKTEAEKVKLFAEYRALAKARRLEKMHVLYGAGPIGRRCGACVHLVGREFSRTYYKCDRYAVTGGTATDWKLSWEACGKFEERRP